MGQVRPPDGAEVEVDWRKARVGGFAAHGPAARGGGLQSQDSQPEGSGDFRRGIKISTISTASTFNQRNDSNQRVLLSKFYDVA